MTIRSFLFSYIHHWLMPRLPLLRLKSMSTRNMTRTAVAALECFYTFHLNSLFSIIWLKLVSLENVPRLKSSEICNPRCIKLGGDQFCDPMKKTNFCDVTKRIRGSKLWRIFLKPSFKMPSSCCVFWCNNIKLRVNKPMSFFPQHWCIYMRLKKNYIRNTKVIRRK